MLCRNLFSRPNTLTAPRCQIFPLSPRRSFHAHPIVHAISEAMITIPDAEKPKKLTLAGRVSSLGILDRLPPEILYMLLGRLDIQSITNFVRVSFRGNSYIQSLRAYRDLVAFAPQTLMALGKTGLLNLHSVTELHAALRQERCASCVEYGSVFATTHHYECFHQKKQKDILVFQSGISDDYPPFPLFLATMAYPAPPLRGLAGSLV